MADLSGHTLGRYRILERLGEGGMATVYKAYDSMLEREVAIKIIRRDAFPLEILHDVLKRFEREAKSLAKLSHPNIVKVLDFGEHDGSPFLVLEYLAGGTLKQKVGIAMPWQEAVRLLLPIARGIEYAHRRGVIHRDIKPANILMTEDNEPTLSDFGIAKIFGGEQTTNLTGSGMAIGTPEYMAPEQWTGETSIQSDIYALGIVLYELVTGRKPYIAETPGGILIKQVSEPLPSPRHYIPDLPIAVEAVLLKALAKDTKDRYADMQTLISALHDLLTNAATIPITSVQPNQTETLVVTTAQEGRATLPPDERVVADSQTHTVAGAQERSFPKESAKSSLQGFRKTAFWGIGVLIAIVLILSIGLPRLQKYFADIPVATATSPAAIATMPGSTPTLTVTALPPSATFTPSPTSTELITSTATSEPVLTPTASMGEQQLLFSEYSEGARNYYLFHISTGKKDLLDFPGSAPWYLAVSSSTNRVAYAAGNGIYVVNMDLSDSRIVAEHPAAASDPLWSPDGGKIVFSSTRYRFTKEDLFIYDLASEVVTPLPCIGATNPLYRYITPLAWSHDGETIAVLASYIGSDKPNGIYITDVECKQLTLISDQPESGTSFSWSPDDQQIAFSAYNEIFISDPDGTNKKQITKNVYWDDNVSWSPDGTKLAYDSYDRINEKYWINIINPDGSGLIQVADGRLPIWLSDGKTVVFQTSQGISLINVETKEEKSVYSSSNYLEFSWGR